MQKKTLLQQNSYFKNRGEALFYATALRANVLSSMAIESVRKAAENVVSAKAVSQHNSRIGS